MNNTALLILAGTETSESKAKFSLAMLAARELFENDENFKVIIEGAAVNWISEVLKEDHKIHSFFMKIKDKVEVCGYCASSFGVKEVSQEAGLHIATEYKGHPSIRNLIVENYTILTY